MEQLFQMITRHGCKQAKLVLIRQMKDPSNKFPPTQKIININYKLATQVVILTVESKRSSKESYPLHSNTFNRSSIES